MKKLACFTYYFLVAFVILATISACRVPQNTGPSIGPILPSGNPSVSPIPAG